MNDDPCKEEKKRYHEARRKLMEIMKNKPRMPAGTTEIHNQPDSKISKQKPPAKDASERGKKELAKAQQEKDRAHKEYVECKEKLEN
jgi:hypothetical protein